MYRPSDSPSRRGSGRKGGGTRRCTTPGEFGRKAAVPCNAGNAGCGAGGNITPRLAIPIGPALVQSGNTTNVLGTNDSATSQRLAMAKRRGASIRRVRPVQRGAFRHRPGSARPRSQNPSSDPKRPMPDRRSSAIPSRPAARMCAHLFPLRSSPIRTHNSTLVNMACGAEGNFPRDAYDRSCRKVSAGSDWSDFCRRRSERWRCCYADDRRRMKRRYAALLTRSASPRVDQVVSGAQCYGEVVRAASSNLHRTRWGWS